jgi:SAM-dependent methyltransferase
MTEPTGERFIPEAMGGQLIEAEHVARYALAAQLARGRRVLDAACGVGWGTGLLLAAGASGASGFDLDADAVADARRRVPLAHFVQGDLTRLPWADRAFDLVVCFEALEHVAGQEQTLDELARVLAPDGLLLVSSPNPRVYPAGNPFHVHELGPEELLEAVGDRLPNVTLWAQHTQIASVLAPDGALAPGANHEVLARVVSPLRAGGDPYSMVVAGRGPLPALLPLVSCAPSEQLLHLEALADRLAHEGVLMADNEQRVRTEREAILSDRVMLLHHLTEQQAAGAALEAQVAHLVQVREALRREREHTAALLLETEQQLATALSTAQQEEAEADIVQAEYDIVETELREVGRQLEDEVAGLRSSMTAVVHQHEDEAAAIHRAMTGMVQELEDVVADLRASTSWRVTAPLRAVGRLRPGRK